MRFLFLAGAACIAAGPCAAQDLSVEAHGIFAETIHTHQKSWGAGAQLAALFGATQSPVRLGSSVAGDFQKQENGGPRQWDASVDVTLQPGGSSAVTPYAGGSVSANWIQGNGSALAGFQGIVGVEIKPSADAPLSVHLEVRPGYVKNQEHTISLHLGLAHSL
jgi:hypothetical protein